MNSFNAFVCRIESLNSENENGSSLSGLKFAVKDMIDVKGFVTGCGNPDFAKDHNQVASKHATIVEIFLKSGALIVGKTICDELAFSCRGMNDWYGSPINPKAPDRIAGGSSCGSAVAVAGGCCDFSLGTDTGCSVRLPAALCGVFGIRTSHNSLPMNGVKPLAASFDTVGWFSTSAEVLQRVGSVLFRRADVVCPSVSRFLIARDAFALMDTQAASVLLKIAQRFTTDEVEMFQCASANEWLECYLAIAGREIFETHRSWIESKKPTFGESVKRGFKNVAEIADEKYAKFLALRSKLTTAMHALLPVGTVIIAPVSHSIALRRDATSAEFNEFTKSVLTLNSVASVARLPQVVVPATSFEGCPLGISFIGWPNSDESLLQFVVSTKFGE